MPSRSGESPAFDIDAILADVERLITCESPSSDLSAVAQSAELVAALGAERLGSRPELLSVDGRAHLRWKYGTGPTRVLLLGHHDTVWPIGSLETHPFTVVDGLLRGPGCFDMKTGLVMALHAAASLDDPTGLAILITGDEELGAPSSRELIEDTARGCSGTLVLEAAAEGGRLKCERKGISRYDVHVHGRAAHAGLEPERGVNATTELAHQVLQAASLADVEAGTTVTPTLAASGTTANTVPAEAHFAVDVRAPTAAEQARVDHALRALQPMVPGAQVSVDGGPNRPPLEASASAELYAHACRVAARLGIEVPGRAAVGGGSDGNLTAGIGVPTLDGMGAVGGGAHADDEHVLVDRIAERTALVAALTDELLHSGTQGTDGP